jgi:NMD protein affecting ribosome stability and mRNA decay
MTREHITSRTPSPTKGKGLIRSLNRASTSSNKTPSVEAARGRPAEPSACERCGAIFSRRVWRHHRKVTHAFLDGASWTTCPACQQTGQAVGFGRVLIRGPYATAHEDAIRRRIANVTARAAYTQPERRVSSIERQRDTLEVLTTSQKLAHRIVRELKKAFGGRASYAWSDDGTLFATWQR